MKMTAVFSQTEFVHGQFPFKSLEMTIDSNNSLGEKMCGGGGGGGQYLSFTDFLSKFLPKPFIFRQFLLLIPVCEHN